VLHGGDQRYKISDETSALVRQAAAALGYTPNKVARGLRLQRTHQIGVIVADVSNHFFSQIVKAVSQEARKAGYSILVCDASESTEVETESLKVLMENRVDGLLVAGVGQGSSSLQKIRSQGIPLVILDRIPDGFSVDAVASDSYRGAYAVVSYLIREGHRKIAIIQGLRGTFVNKERLRGYRQALDDAGIAFEPRYAVGHDFSTVNGYLETKAFLHIADPPTAIFTVSDAIALGALEALRQERWKVPDDMSLVTFDDPVFAASVSPPLTAVAQPVDKMGEIALKLLLRRLREGPTEPRRILLEPRLIIRESVSRPAQKLRPAPYHTP
jgi:LacI family transcriptional regulator